MKLYVPALGDVLILTKNWEFPLHWNDRNHTLLNALDGVKHKSHHYYFGWWHKGPIPEPRKVVVPKGTKLTVDRIYIRKGNEDFDSMTFRVGKGDSPSAVFCGTRFWAKLADVNLIEFKAE